MGRSLWPRHDGIRPGQSLLRLRRDNSDLAVTHAFAALEHVIRLQSKDIAQHHREVVMFKFNRQFLLITLPVAAACMIGGAHDAVAKKRLSYEQAWTACKAQNDRTVGAGDTANAR